MVHCFDRAPEPPETFAAAKERTEQSGGVLEYHQVDVTQDEALEKCVADIAGRMQRLDGLIAGMRYQRLSTLFAALKLTCFLSGRNPASNASA